MQEGFGLDWVDYGARLKRGPHWATIDPLAEKYPSISPYAFCAGNPINTIDNNGSKIIFINGMYGKSKQGGSPEYWEGFDTKVMAHFNDYNVAYLDGALGGTPVVKAVYQASNILYMPALDIQNRIEAGYRRGASEALNLINSLKRDQNGKVTEKVRIVAHSMGAAYAKGYIQALIEFIKENPEMCNGIQISEYDFAAFQQNMMSSITGASLFQYDNESDGVVGGFLGYLLGSSHAKQPGAELYSPNTQSKGGHRLKDYINIISNLPEGTYKFIDGKFVKQ